MRRTSVDVCIVGAGPHGLAAALHLLAARPRLHDSMVVIDPAGSWLTTWETQFSRFDIGALRSAQVHHPGVDPAGLGQFTRSRRLPTSGLPYGAPLYAVFAEYCNDLIDEHQLDEVLYRGVARAISPRREGGALVETDDAAWVARTVIHAGNPSLPVIPEPFADAVDGSGGSATIRHGRDIDLRQVDDLSGATVMVVGGGLTAGHLVCGAATRGAATVLVTRRPIVERNFDVDPGWLGPLKLDPYERETDPGHRARTALAARGGGSMPLWMLEQLADLEGAGRLRRCCVEMATCSVTLDGARVRLDTPSATIEADHCWLATGTTPSVSAEPALDQAAQAVDMVGDLPVLTADLQFGETGVHSMGRLATIAIGPAAGNLWGARVAARRITKAVTGIDLDHDSTARIPIPNVSV